MDAGTLRIGIGGTSIAARSDLKGKNRHHLIPGPDSNRSGIQLLGIDSDTYSLNPYSGDYRLSSEEFFSIQSPHLAAFLNNPQGRSGVPGSDG